MSDNVSGHLCVRGIITKIENYFKIPLHNVHSIPPFLDEILLKNYRQFKCVRGIWVWKDETGDEEIDEKLSQDLEDIEQIGTYRLKGVQIKK